MDVFWRTTIGNNRGGPATGVYLGNFIYSSAGVWEHAFASSALVNRCGISRYGVFARAEHHIFVDDEFADVVE
jgi:hypothetical protein